MVEVQQVTRAVRTVDAIRREAGAIIRIGVGIVIERILIRTTTGKTRTGHSEHTESIIGGEVIENGTRIVIDDLPLLLSGIHTAGNFEHVALGRGQTEEIIALRACCDREDRIIQRTGIQDFTRLVRQSVGRTVPAVTKGVVHHELDEHVIGVVAAREDTASIIHSGVSVKVEGLHIRTATDFCGRSVVEGFRSSTIVSSDDAAGVDIDQCPTDF